VAGEAPRRAVAAGATVGRPRAGDRGGARARPTARGELPSARSGEIQTLERERGDLLGKLGELAEREAALRAGATRAGELEEERQALEDLLEEALEDVAQKESEIASLQYRLRSEDRKQAALSKGRSREAERVAKRFGALYRNLSVDERAIADLVALGDESLKLRAEAPNASTTTPTPLRSAAGGRPPHLSIFELASRKGRIYYMRRARRLSRWRSAAIQKQDLGI
jgi:chromosome segregation ATPase